MWNYAQFRESIHLYFEILGVGGDGLASLIRFEGVMLAVLQSYDIAMAWGVLWNAMDLTNSVMGVSDWQLYLLEFGHFSLGANILVQFVAYSPVVPIT